MSEIIDQIKEWEDKAKKWDEFQRDFDEWKESDINNAFYAYRKLNMIKEILDTRKLDHD